MDDQRRKQPFLHNWLQTLLEGLAHQEHRQTTRRVLEQCGRACAQLHGPLEAARAISQAKEEIDGLLDQLQQATNGAFLWQREGPTFQITYAQCFCPLRDSGTIDHPTLCHCSRGWLHELFETAYDRPATVETTSTIGAGDPVCRFTVQLD